MPGEQGEREQLRPSVPAEFTGPAPLNQPMSADAAEPTNTVNSAGSAGKETSQATLTREPSQPIGSKPRQRIISGNPQPVSGPLNTRRKRHLSLFMVAGMLALVVILLLLLADVSRSIGPTAIAHRYTPTATPKPTATATTLPTPTVLAGFQLFVDTSDGFMLQYPVGWGTHLTNPGAEFYDDAVHTTFDMQISLVPDPTVVPITGDPNNPTVWVNYFMQKLSTQYESDFQEDVGPLPASVFAGSTWETARGLLFNQVRFQVYATVYQGRPYIILFSASLDAFSIADMVYFQPMRQSFQFLPGAA